MARQLIYGNDIVGFNPASGIITAKGYVPLPKLLSITNSTVNTTLFSFSDPDTTAVVNYDPVNHQTTINLSIDTSLMNANDKLQIFYEKEDIEIAPSKHLLDPVGKLRVSQPESLIDTDFEYGQQSTKWETVKLVNNIPTAYSSAIPEESIEVLSVKCDRGNDFVTVETPEAHNFIVGSVIEVSGLRDPKFEGIFIVRDVTDTTTFSYKVPFKAPRSEQLETEFTTIYPGSFYTGSSIDVLDVETTTSNLGTGSTFLVTTKNIPGIAENTKLFLKGSRATKRYNIQSPSAIVSEPVNNYQTTIHSPGPGIAITRPSSTVYLANLPIIEDDWIGFTEYNFPSSQVSISGTTAGRITIDRNFQLDRAATDRIENDDILVYYTPRGNTHPGPGIGSYHPFKVVGLGTTGGAEPITGTTINITSTQSFNIGTTTYPVRGVLYVPTSLPETNIDVIVAYHPTITSQSQTIMQAAQNTLDVFLNTLNIKDKIIFSVAYPQDAIPAANQFGIGGNEDPNFVFESNLPYARASLLWAKNSLNAFMNANAITKTTSKVFMFGHSQGGSLVHKINTLETTDGVISNAPGPIRLDLTCQSDGSNTTCTKLFNLFGPVATSSQYFNRSVAAYTTGLKSRTLYIQGQQDTTANGNQKLWMDQLIGTLTANGQFNADFTYLPVPGQHDAFMTSVEAQNAIRLFVGSRGDVEGRYINFNLSSTFATNTILNLTSAGTDTFGFHRFMKASGGRILEVDNRGTILFSKKHNLLYNDEIVICTRSTNTGFTTTRGNWLSSVYYKYKVVNVIDEFRISVNPRNYGSQKFATPTERFVCAVKVTPHPMANSFYLPPDDGFTSEDYKTAQQVRYTNNNLGTGGIPSPLVNNRDYLIRQVKDAKGRYFYSLYNFSDSNLTNPLKVNIVNPQNTFRSNNGRHRFTSTLIRNDAYTIRISVPARGDLANNQVFRYSVGTTGQAVGGMSSQGVYFAKTDDTLIGNDQFRVANTATSVDVKTFSFSGYNRSTATFELLTGAAHTAGIARTQFMQVSGYQGTAAENLMIQGLHQVVGIQTYTYYYYYYTRRWRRRWRRRYYWYYWRVWQVRRREPITTVTVSVPTTKNRLNVFYKKITSTSVKACGIVSLTSPGGVGTHIITIESKGAVDDTYLVKQVQPTSFTFECAADVPEVINSMSGGDGSRVGVGSNWIRIQDHRLADGTKIRYETGGFANIQPLVSGQEYFVRALDGNHIGLTTDQDVAINRNNDTDNVSLITLTSLGSTTTHQFISKSIKGFITGPGTIGVTTESNLVRGTSTKFYTDFSNGDMFRIWWKVGASAGPGTYFESRIVEVKSDTVIKLEDEVGIETSSANYFIPTRLYAVSDAKVVHRPFDGALSMTTGLTPNTQLIRQTRRYFRYQAGKGIQCSMAVNFNPTFDIDSIDIDGTVGVSTNLIVTTKFPHGLSTEAPLDDEQRFQVLNVTYPVGLNTEYVIKEVIDDFKVRIQTPTPLVDPTISGFPQFNITHWRDGRLKCGMFDDQNGFFFMFDGDKLNVVRRSNTQQLAGRITLTRGENLIRASEGKFRSQLRPSDKITLRGQTYKVVSILDDDLLYIQPAYRGKTITNVVASKVIDTIIPQSEWNIDRMDGTGYSGYKIDTNRVQMVYMDYSWYGAGTIRFGMKTQMGDIKYCHEFIHNNQFTEAYMRSGNLPVRYEVETLDDPFFAPSLYHWGVSVIMDGRFDQDKSYHFTADSKVLPFTNGGVSNVGGVAPNAKCGAGSTEIAIYNGRGNTLAVGQVVTSSVNGIFQKNTRITAIEMDPIDPTWNGGWRWGYYYYWWYWWPYYAYWNFNDDYRIFVDKETLLNRDATFPLYAYSGTAETLKEMIPLVSIRLSPSVDNSTTGGLGYRDIVNRMQILLRSANVITSHDVEVELIVNGKLQAEDDFESVGSPSLCQLFRHDVGDTITGGQVIYSFRAQGGTTVENVLWNGWNRGLKRSLNGTTIDLHEVAVLGNSVLGGDSLYPDGPDVLTLAVKPIDTSGIKGSSPLLVSARLTWIESQA